MLSASAQAEDEAIQLEEVQVSGGDAEEIFVPNAPARVSKKKIEIFQYTDVSRALRQTPGVYVREEDGQGLRPNIGLRGTNPDRSKKVVLLEDGVLIGPAPYSAPAAYYTPEMSHIESLEIFRGFAAIPYGPNSIGGVVNYLSPTIPENLEAKVTAQRGSFATNNFKIQGGGPVAGRLSVLALASYLDSDGFKEIDGGGDAGFRKRDLGLQFRLPLSAAGQKDHRLSLRLGYSDELSRETYVGLSAADFQFKPYRRYLTTNKDNMRWDHSKLQLEHLLQLSENGLLRTTAYRHDFHRVWYRLDRFHGTNPTSLHEILKIPFGTNQAFYDILSGSADSSTLGNTGQLRVASNDRTFVSQGLQTKYFDAFATGPFEHSLELGALLHYDEIERNHTYDVYQVENRQFLPTASMGIRDAKNKDSANARTLSFQDNATLGPVVFTAAGRYENVSFQSLDHVTGLETRRKDDVFVPGAGILVKASDHVSSRFSWNKAVTIAGLDAAGGNRREEADNFELGAKYFHPGLDQMLDLTGFWNKYRNITGTCTAPSGCVANGIDLQFSGGRARVLGVEASAAQGISLGKVRLPVGVNLTWIQGTFESSFHSQNPDWGMGLVNKGDPLPYVPRLQYALSLGMEYKKFQQEFAIVYQTKMVDQAVQNLRAEVPPYGIVDWSARFQFSKRASLFGKADNLLGKEYLVSYRPYGARPGKPRSFLIGFSYGI